MRSFTQPAGNLLDYRPWRIRRGAAWRAVDAEARAHRGGFVACIDGTADRDGAACLRGVEIGVPESALPPAVDGEFYWRDLTGLRVSGSGGDDLGTVSRVFATPAHDVLVVTSADGERLIPFVREIVRSVDVGGGRLVADWSADWQ